MRAALCLATAASVSSGIDAAPNRRMQDWSAINATSGDWSSTDDLSQCPLTSSIAALNNPCSCSCDAAATPGCTENSQFMYDATGYTCGQVAGGTVPNLACNQLVRDITAAEAYTLWQQGDIDLIVDVRSQEEYEGLGDPSQHNVCGGGWTDTWDGCEIGHVPGAFLVPLNPWDASSLASCQNLTVATICYNHASHPNSTWRSNTGAALLEAAGFGCVFNIVDGTKGWMDLGFPVESGAWTPNLTCEDPAFFEVGVGYVAPTPTPAPTTPAAAAPPAGSAAKIARAVPLLAVGLAAGVML